MIFLVSLLKTLSKSCPWGQHPIININVLIFICKFNHGDFNSYDVFSSNIYCTYCSTEDGLIPKINPPLRGVAR